MLGYALKMKFKYLLPLVLLLVSCTPQESELKIKKSIEPEVKYKPKKWDSKESALASCDNEEFYGLRGNKSNKIVSITEVSEEERSAVFIVRNPVMEEKVLCFEVGENGRINYKRLDFKWLNP